MALRIPLASFKEAVRAIQEQGVSFAGLNLDAIYAQELELAELVVRIFMTDVARVALELATTAEAVGASVDYVEVLSQALDKFDPRLAADTSLRTAYAAGRWDRMQAAPSMSYLVYRSMRDSRVRPEHDRLNGVALPKSDAFWRSHYPPIAYRCRCKVFATDYEGLQRLGIKPLDEAPDEPTREVVNPRTGATERLPVSVSPGFLVNGKTPALAARESLSNLLSEKLLALQQQTALF